MGNTAKKVADMDFSEKFNFSSNDEIGELGRNLNIMEMNLKRNFDILKKDIELEKENDKMRKEFISNISHELKTPIAIINNYAEGLKEGIADDEESRNFYLDTILEETANMNDFVNSLLFLSRSERNFLEFNLVNFDIREIIITYSAFLLQSSVSRSSFCLKSCLVFVLSVCLYISGSPFSLT